MTGEGSGSGEWDGRERRRNPVGRLLWAREARKLLRDLAPGERSGRFRREREDGAEDPRDGGEGTGPEG